jgi:hypothetical protein
MTFLNAFGIMYVLVGEGETYGLPYTSSIPQKSLHQSPNHHQDFPR